MTLKGKYEEVMDHIEVTDEMRTRVLENVERELEKKPSKKMTRTRNIRRYSAIAAAFAVVLIGAFTYQRVMETSTEDALMTPTTFEGYGSREELEDVVGFEVKELINLPFESRRVVYLALFGDGAEICYIAPRHQITFTMISEIGGNLGHYETYEFEEVVEWYGLSVTLKSNSEGTYILTWVDGDFEYMIYSDVPMEKEVLLRMIPIDENLVGTQIQEPTTVSLIMVGDILIHNPIYEKALQADGTYDFTPIFEDTKEISVKADLAILNQETILAGEEFDYSGYPAFNSPQEVGDAEVKAGYDVILSATNHALDRGAPGILADLQWWEESHPEVVVLGIHDSEEDASEIYITTIHDMKIAILNYTYGTNGISEPRDYLVDDLEEQKIREEVAWAEENADFTIVCPHWGTEYSLSESSNQEYYANLFCELGADLILGAHPHVIQPVKWITSENGNQCLCYYSVGNFVTGTADSGTGIMNRVVSGMAQVELTRDESGEVVISSADILPLVCHWENDTYRVIPLTEYTEEQAEANEIRYRDSTFSLDSVNALVDQVWGTDWRVK